MKGDSSPLPLSEYRQLINLDEPFASKTDSDLTKINYLDNVTKLLEYLDFNNSTDVDYNALRKELLRLLTLQPPTKFPKWFLEANDLILQKELREKKVINSKELTRLSPQYPNLNNLLGSKCSLWQGDITALKIDGIVNAAKSSLLGCFTPFHKCIDNVIHTAAGPQVRYDCNNIIKEQGYNEEVGWAKITRAYNLPSKYIIHTVGPNVTGVKQITHDYQQQLADCYLSCLNLALEIEDLRSIAFCCISTGVFSFPNDLAAQIAIDTVQKWLKVNSDSIDLIVFNVYSNKDLGIYNQLFSKMS